MSINLFKLRSIQGNHVKEFLSNSTNLGQLRRDLTNLSKDPLGQFPSWVMKLGARSSEFYCPLPNRSLFLLEPWSLPKHGVYFSREFVPFLKHRSLFLLGAV